MKKVSLLIVLFCFFFSTAQEQSEKSLLWKIEGKGLSKPSYLFGTMHIICNAEYIVTDKVVKAFEKTDKLVIEVDMTDPSEMQEAQKMMQTDKTLSSQLNEQQQKDFNEILTKNFRLTLQQVDAMSPSSLSMVLAYKSIKCPMTELKSFENDLIERAKKGNKSIGALEKVVDQASKLQDAYPLSEIIAQMAIQPEYAILLADWMRLYKEENFPELYKSLMDKRFLNQNARKAMLTDRNANWVQKMPAVMQQQSTFFAVGAAHLGGEDGVITLLKKAGYKVTAVYN